MRYLTKELVAALSTGNGPPTPELKEKWARRVEALNQSYLAVKPVLPAAFRDFTANHNLHDGELLAARHFEIDRVEVDRQYARLPDGRASSPCDAALIVVNLEGRIYTLIYEEVRFTSGCDPHRDGRCSPEALWLYDEVGLEPDGTGDGRGEPTSCLRHSILFGRGDELFEIEIVFRHFRFTKLETGPALRRARSFKRLIETWREEASNAGKPSTTPTEKMSAGHPGRVDGAVES